MSASHNPAAQPIPSAAPSTPARVLAIVVVLLGGAMGALIGWAFVDLQCTGDCGGWTGFGALVGATAGAAGLAVIAVLTLRAVGEWRALEAQRRLEDDGD